MKVQWRQTEKIFIFNRKGVFRWHHSLWKYTHIRNVNSDHWSNLKLIFWQVIQPYMHFIYYSKNGNYAKGQRNVKFVFWFNKIKIFFLASLSTSFLRDFTRLCLRIEKDKVMAYPTHILEFNICAVPYCVLSI